MSYVTIFFGPHVVVPKVHVALSNSRNCHVALLDLAVKGHHLGAPGRVYLPTCMSSDCQVGMESANISLA